jgi:hypothetical protein
MRPRVVQKKIVTPKPNPPSTTTTSTAAPAAAVVQNSKTGIIFFVVLFIAIVVTVVVLLTATDFFDGPLGLGTSTGIGSTATGTGSSSTGTGSGTSSASTASDTGTVAVVTDDALTSRGDMRDEVLATSLVVGTPGELTTAHINTLKTKVFQNLYRHAGSNGYTPPRITLDWHTSKLTDFVKLHSAVQELKSIDMSTTNNATHSVFSDIRLSSVSSGWQQITGDITENFFSTDINFSLDGNQVSFYSSIIMNARKVVFKSPPLAWDRAAIKLELPVGSKFLELSARIAGITGGYFFWKAPIKIIGEIPEEPSDYTVPVSVQFESVLDTLQVIYEHADGEKYTYAATDQARLTGSFSFTYGTNLAMSLNPFGDP